MKDFFTNNCFQRGVGRSNFYSSWNLYPDVCAKQSDGMFLCVLNIFDGWMRAETQRIRQSQVSVVAHNRYFWLILYFAGQNKRKCISLGVFLSFSVRSFLSNPWQKKKKLMKKYKKKEVHKIIHLEECHVLSYYSARLLFFFLA